MNIGRFISNRRSNIMAIQSYVQRGARSGGLVLRQSCIAKVSGEDGPKSQFSLQPTVAISNTNTNSDQQSMRYLTLCGIGICSASIFGISQQQLNSNNMQRRGYRSSKVATCEPSKPTKENRSNEANESTTENSTSDNKSSSFFDIDMAQQWATDYTSKKDDKSMNISDAQSTNSMDRKEQQQQTPEALLEALGIIGGSVDKNLDKNGERSGDIHDRSNKEEEEPRNLMQKVLFKFDDLKSSLPRSTSIDKERTNNTSNTTYSSRDDDDNSTLFDDFLSFANKAESLFTSRKSSKPPNIEELIEQAQSIANNTVSSSQSSNNSSSSSGFLSQVLYVQQNAQALQSTFESSFEPHLSNINVKDLFQSIPVAALHYYLEYQDSIKTPSWKRRIHRFQKDVEVNKVEELNEALLLSELSYADGVDEIRNGLHRLYNNNSNNNGKKNMNKPQWELLFCDTESRPNQPSHFLAIQKNASSYDDTLHVLMVVRGTKNFSDLITDAMMEASDYEYNSPNGKGCDVIKGKAHSGMQLSGKYLVDRHQKLLSTLLKLSKKRKLEITLIGHSLGAGAASIAAMEWNSRDSFEEHGSDNVDVSAHVIGFGCPAVLSKELSMATKEYITTVVADADFIPRMSGATLVNLLLDVTRFDYQKQAERDVEQALRAAKSRLALGLDEDDIQTVMGYVSSGLEKIANPMAPPSVDKSTTEDKLPATTKEEDNKVQEQLPIVLFPPGECIHFYRDGSGISGSYVPCTFFDEIDIARTCVDDHLISSGYRRIFLSLMRDFTKDDHFSFDKKKEE